MSKLFGLGGPLFDRIPMRAAIIAPLLLAAYIVSQCPCDQLPKCKQTDFFALLAVSALAALSDLTC